MKAIIKWFLLFWTGDFGDQHECGADLGADEAIALNFVYRQTHRG